MKRIKEELANLIKDNINSDVDSSSPVYIKTVYQGEVDPVPRSYLPAVMIVGDETENVPNGTAKDRRTHKMRIVVIVDITNYFTEEGTGDIIKVQQALEDLMEATDTEGVCTASSVLGILRRNIRGTYFMFNTNEKIQYTRFSQGKFFYAKAEMTLEAVTDQILRQ